MINKILEKDIFKPKLRESSSCIVKVRNLDTVRIVTERMSGEKEERYLTDECDTDTENGLKQMKKILKKITDIKSKESRVYRSVDVGFPIPFLKVNFLLNDRAVLLKMHIFNKANTPVIAQNNPLKILLTMYMPIRSR